MLLTYCKAKIWYPEIVENATKLEAPKHTISLWKRQVGPTRLPFDMMHPCPIIDLH